MKFETKISGTKVTEFGDIKPMFPQLISIQEVIEAVRKQETMNFILDTFRFHKGNESTTDWFTTMDMDSIMKITIMEKEECAEIKKELEEYFGKDWVLQYIRFNH